MVDDAVTDEFQGHADFAAAHPAAGALPADVRPGGLVTFGATLNGCPTAWPFRRLCCWGCCLALRYEFLATLYL